MKPAIQPMLPAHWEEVRAIYEEGIRTGNATFETRSPDWREWDGAHLADCRLVAMEGDRVLGWAALSPVSERCVYNGVGETSVYVAATARGRGIGKALLLELAKESEKAGIWTLQAGMFPENRASVELHRACGFRDVGLRKRLGQLQGNWRDVLLMERRSQTVGI